jgi:hypothetical protein
MSYEFSRFRVKFETFCLRFREYFSHLRRNPDEFSSSKSVHS